MFIFCSFTKWFQNWRKNFLTSVKVFLPITWSQPIYLSWPTVMRCYQNLLLDISYFYWESQPAEVGKWKKSYKHVPQENKPSSANLALIECSPQIFPALHKIVVILLTTPVGSVNGHFWLSVSSSYGYTLLWLKNTLVDLQCSKSTTGLCLFLSQKRFTPERLTEGSS